MDEDRAKALADDMLLLIERHRKERGITPYDAIDALGMAARTVFLCTQAPPSLIMALFFTFCFTAIDGAATRIEEQGDEAGRTAAN
jgi:hypothetical protein